MTNHEPEKKIHRNFCCRYHPRNIFPRIRSDTHGNSPNTGHAPVNGLNLYYEIHDTGEPLILLHRRDRRYRHVGPNLPALSEKRKVIAVELQGHGRTADIDRPLSFEAMADDIAALMKYLGIERADVMGYSLGGGVALQTAIRHPGSVRKLVVVSAPFKRDGWYPRSSPRWRRWVPLPPRR
jgi:pimeloyl-ACP methyl ester carboxylesterase